VAGAPLPLPLRQALESLLGAGQTAENGADRAAGAVRAELIRVRLHGGPFARWLCRRFGAGAVTFGRRVLCSAAAWQRLATNGDPGALALAAHEAVHVLQYRRDGFVPMLARYVWEYLRGRLAGLSHAAAYRAISYEREAFAVEAAARGGRQRLKYSL
jgi:hypothetical protein